MRQRVSQELHACVHVCVAVAVCNLMGLDSAQDIEVKLACLSIWVKNSSPRVGHVVLEVDPGSSLQEQGWL